MEATVVGSRPPVPLAKSCLPCALAKSRCSGYQQTGCERCNRLGKNCCPRVSVRTRKPAKKSQASRLEERLDGLVSLLSAGQQTQIHTGAFKPPSNPSEPSTTLSEERWSQSPTYNHAPPSACPSLSASDPSKTAAPSPATSPLFAVDSEAYLAEADRLVNLYRWKLQAGAPYVILPPDLSTEKLRREKPLLFRAVLDAASYRNPQHQAALREDVLQYLKDNLFEKPERQLGTLQGILVYISWHHHHMPYVSQLNVILSLMYALVNDLILGRTIVSCEEVGLAVPESKLNPYPATRKRIHTLEERRTLLGCFYLSSCITALWSNVDPMRFTPYMSECCDVLLSAKEYDSDIVLVELVKIQCVLQKIRTSFPPDSLFEQKPLVASLAMHVKNLDGELKTIKKLLPASVQQNKTVLVGYLHAQVKLFEIGFYLSPAPGVALQPLELLGECLATGLSFIEIAQTIPASETYGFSFPTYGQYFHCLITTARLCRFDNPGWDRQFARKQMDVSSLIDLTIRRMQEANELHGPGTSEGVYAKIILKFGILKQAYEKHCAVDSQKEQMLTPGPNFYNDMFLLENPYFWDDSFEYDLSKIE